MAALMELSVGGGGSASSFGGIGSGKSSVLVSLGRFSLWLRCTAELSFQ